MSINFNFKFKSNILPTYFNKQTDSIYVCGSIEQLGNWNVKNAIELNQFDDKWSLKVDVSNYSNEKISYKYFIAKKVPLSSGFFIKKVETEQRVKFINDEINDIWGLKNDTDDIMSVNIGWLLEHEIELRLNFYNKPLKIFSKYKNESSNYSISITPFKVDDDDHMEIDNYLYSIREFNNEQIFDEPKVLHSLVSSDYYGVANVRTFEDPKNLVFRIEVNGLGVNYLKLPQNLFDNSLTRIELALHNPATTKLVGHLNVELLLIKSLPAGNVRCSINTNYTYDYTRAGLAAGHRGIGKTFDADHLETTEYVSREGGSVFEEIQNLFISNFSIIENTIESFQEALNNGAQMVEFDVVLTKDNQPVIYHDYSVCLRSENDANKYIDIGIHQLTYEELKNSKIYAHKILKRLQVNDEIHRYTSEKMFPTLREVFDHTNENLAFDIEIKYPLELEDGNNEADTGVKWMDRNKYVDIILNELLVNCKVNKRSAVLTSFDPYICAMLQMKQNKFPVLYITNGLTKKWVPYFDFRSKNTKISTIFAKADDLNGVVLHAEELVNDNALFEFLQKFRKDSKFLIYAWGDDLNKYEIRQLFSKLRFDAIIYDRINEL